MNFSAGCVMKQTGKVFLQHRSFSRKQGAGVRLTKGGKCVGPAARKTAG